LYVLLHQHENVKRHTKILIVQRLDSPVFSAHNIDIRGTGLNPEASGYAHALFADNEKSYEAYFFVAWIF